jgi:hypothetical protein
MQRTLVLIGVFFLFNANSTQAQEAAGQAATVAEARTVLDLSGKPLVNSLEDAQTQVAFQNFRSQGNPLELAKKIDAELQSRGLKKMEGAAFTEAYSTASYQKSGFTISLMVMPTGEPEISMVSINNQGNVDIRKLPKPEGAKELYVQPTSGIYVCDLAVDKAKSTTRELLERDGWHWFGDTTVSYFMRKNAVRLQVMCSESPAQAGKTTLQYSTEQMSAALPAIPDLIRISYSDSTMWLDGDSKLEIEPFVAKYRKTLEAEGWKATTENPIKIDFNEHLIFRNKDNDLAELVFRQVDSITRFELKFMTAAQVDAESKLAEKAAADAEAKRKIEIERMKNPPKISIEKPETSTLSEESKQSLEFTVASGTAKKVVTKWLEAQKANGWKVQATVDRKELGEFELTNGEMKINVSFVDPGFIPGEITIKTSTDYQFDLKK